jgi:hypothetical protein
MIFDELCSNIKAHGQLPDSCVTGVHSETPEKFYVHLATSPGRSQIVTVKRIVDGGREYACCFAAGYRVPKGESLPPELALELLRRNEDLPYCWYLSNDDQPWLAVKSPPYLLRTTNLVALMNTIYTVACIADEFETEIGRDDY